jgi:hypothetical protein
MLLALGLCDFVIVDVLDVTLARFTVLWARPVPEIHPSRCLQMATGARADSGSCARRHADISDSAAPRHRRLAGQRDLSGDPGVV